MTCCAANIKCPPSRWAADIQDENDDFAEIIRRQEAQEVRSRLAYDNPLAQNLLILAYEKPVAVAELSQAIGVPAAYTEPVIKKLVKNELMKQMRSIPIL